MNLMLQVSIFFIIILVPFVYLVSSVYIKKILKYKNQIRNRLSLEDIEQFSYFSLVILLPALTALRFKIAFFIVISFIIFCKFYIYFKGLSKNSWLSRIFKGL